MSQSHTLPDLPYDYSALEPVISGEIMELHHKKHHNAYVTNLNKALENLQAAEAKGDVTKQIQLQSAVKFNGGGHINHSIFWTNLTPGGSELKGELKTQIEAGWGSLDAFITDFNAKAAGVQGSGWQWLAYCKERKAIQLVSMPNQDPVGMIGYTPLLGIDVWEHAYYLQYKNVRPDYLKAIWQVVNWENVSQRYMDAMKS